MAAKSAPVNEGDWICADKDCGNINFTWRARCNRCGKEKGKVDIFKKTGSEIGKSAAAKSGGLFSAEDWQCSKCGNVNWARRNTCNICNEPKFGKVEARTGLGGGYNERDEIIEYKYRDDSDGELDEFGRKKKKLRKTSNQQQTSTYQERKRVAVMKILVSMTFWVMTMMMTVKITAKVTMEIKKGEQEVEAAQMNGIMGIIDIMTQDHLAGGIVHDHHDKVVMVVVCYISSSQVTHIHTHNRSGIILNNNNATLYNKNKQLL